MEHQRIAAKALPPAPSSKPLPPGAIKRRSAVACRRCRRMRSKCTHDRGKPPCVACREANIGPEGCIFPTRGQPDQDREYRHPRAKSDKPTRKDSAKVATPGSLKDAKAVDQWDFLPPVPEVIEAVNKFTQLYFQLGFIPKKRFIDRLKTDHRSVSAFLLLSVLSISARFTLSLIVRYGNGVKAAELFMDRASAVALTELYQEPSLERCQAFYLLSIAQQGSGWKNRSSINMGIAMRMAILMRLHREETYTLPKPTKDLIITAESARRTLWMLHSQDNLHSGPSSPVSLGASDITALLPGNEEDFARGVLPRSRAALVDTPPAVENPRLVSDPGRSLFATLIQTHYFWGMISRRAVGQDRSSSPWQPGSEYAVLERRLRQWEASLPHEHRWSPFLLKGYKASGQELAYLAVTMVVRLCNIVLRKPYLNSILRLEDPDPGMRNFWLTMSLKLFKNVWRLYEQIEAQFRDRSPDDSTGAQVTAFCVFSCGHMATYLCKYPEICADQNISRAGPVMVHRAMTILAEAKDVWPLATRWYEGLEKFVKDNKVIMSGLEGSMADGSDPVPDALRPPNPTAPSRSASPSAAPTTPDDEQAEADSDEDEEEEDDDASMSAAAAPESSSASSALYTNQPAQAGQQQQGPAAVQGQRPLPQQAPQPFGGRQPASDGLGLLIEAFDTHQGGGGGGGMGVPAGLGVPPGPAALMGGQPAAEYYAQPGVAPNDGYENELQFYIDGAPNLQGWVPNSGMYGY